MDEKEVVLMIGVGFDQFLIKEKRIIVFF